MKKKRVYFVLILILIIGVFSAFSFPEIINSFSKKENIFFSPLLKTQELLKIREPVCEPTKEVCDGKDNDCDKEIDEGGVCEEESLNFKITLDEKNFKINEEEDHIKLEVEGFDKISFAEGKPLLPEKTYTYLIPEGKKVKGIEINKIDYSDSYLSRPIEVSPKPELCCMEEIKAEDVLKDYTKFFPTDSFVPEKPLELISSGYVRGRTLAQVSFSPFQYNPIQNKLRSINSIDFDFILEDENIQIIRNDMNEFLEPLIENKDALIGGNSDTPLHSGTTEYYDENTPFDYLIITNEDLKPYYEPLAEWKRQKGLNVKIVTVEEIYSYWGRDKQEKIREFIKFMYSKDGLKWVLLGGDEDVIPLRYLYYEDTYQPPRDLYHLIPSDLYYGDMNGEWEVDGDGIWGEPNHDSPDIYVDVPVGRIPLKQPIDIQSVIEKIINYEKNPGNGDPSYVTDAILFASDQMRDYPEGGESDFVAQAFPANFNTDTNTLDEMLNGADPQPVSPFGVEIVDELSNSYGNVYYFAHGSYDRFVAKSPGHYEGFGSLVLLFSDPPYCDYNHGCIDHIENYGKPSFIYTISCNNGMIDVNSVDPTLPEDFDYSIVEWWLKQPNAGAFAFVGNARWGWVSYSYLLASAFAEFSLDYQEPLGLALLGSVIVYPYKRDLIYGLNLHGDPETRLYTEVPQQLVQVVNINLETSTANILVIKEGHPVEEAIITIGNNEGAFLRTLTGAEGDVEIDLTQILNPNIKKLIVTSFKYNTIPAQTILNKYYYDGDGDGHGVVSPFVFAESTPQGFSEHFEDCDDTNYWINPGKTESCNNELDDDCNGFIDTLDISACTCEGRGIGVCVQITDHDPDCPDDYPYKYDNKPNMYCSGEMSCCSTIVPKIE